MKNKTKESLKKALKTTLQAIGLEYIEDKEQEYLDEPIIAEPTIRLLRKTIELKETKLSGRIMNAIGLAQAIDILIPEYMLDEENNISSEINYNLVPEEKRELVKQLGPFYLESIKEKDEEMVVPIFLDRQIAKTELEEVRNSKPKDAWYEIWNWDVFAERFLSPFIQTKQNYINDLIVNQIPTDTTLTQEGITGEIDTVDRRRKIIMTSCALAAIIMVCGLIVFGTVDNCNKIYNGETPELIFKLTDPMSSPEMYLPFSR